MKQVFEKLFILDWDKSIFLLMVCITQKDEINDSYEMISLPSTYNESLGIERLRDMME